MRERGGPDGAVFSSLSSSPRTPALAARVMRLAIPMLLCSLWFSSRLTQALLAWISPALSSPSTLRLLVGVVVVASSLTCLPTDFVGHARTSQPWFSFASPALSLWMRVDATGTLAGLDRLPWLLIEAM